MFNRGTRFDMGQNILTVNQSLTLGKIFPTVEHGLTWDGTFLKRGSRFDLGEDLLNRGSWFDLGKSIFSRRHGLIRRKYFNRGTRF